MITLIVPEYCQSCTDFEPQVTQRPEQVETGYGNLAAKPFMSIWKRIRHDRRISI